MCSQYTIKATSKELSEQYRIPTLDDVRIDTRVVPYTPAIVIVQNENKREFAKMNYSLVPSWSKEPKVKFATHNARVETIVEKPAWKIPFQTRRCLVPISEFVESIYENKWAGNMVLFSKANDQLLTAAGIWDIWYDPVNKTSSASFAIVTEEPPPYILEAGHDRCPIFLKEEAFDSWLNPKESNPKNLLQILQQGKETINFATKIDRPLKAGWEKRK